ncbi:uncharacterized protein LOC124933055 [Impatiens glandulifera]|uniref:uncharacterized protein LOC124933055 n=1 Tax=Impatiens glandulifera TaxID=253017 RepID=UPI001FB11C3A|nr:uncharacterized protein LOC124933055 [Impatiens glandulifera]
MTGNGRFDMDSGIVEPGFMGSFANGPKGNHSGPTLDRSGSFREGGESRSFSSGNSTFRSSNQLAGGSSSSLQGLMLDPITMGVLKSRSNEFRRILSVFGLASEENSLGTAHSRPIPFAAADELKRYKDTITEVNNKARAKVNKLSENLQILNKIIEAQSSKKQQRNDPSSNERSSGSNLKIGAQIYRNSPVDDRAKTGVPNKRVRTSVADTQLESRSNGISKQSLSMAKGRDLLKDSTSQPDMAEEKIRRLPAGGESWDKNMKRKRSVSTVFTRSLDDRDQKRPMHQKAGNEGGSLGDFHASRSGFSSANSGPPKTDIIPSPVILNASAMTKHEQEKASPRDLAPGQHTDRLITKGNNGIREENQMGNVNPVTKTKASRAPRGVPVASVNSSTSILRPGAPEFCEQPSNLNKIHVPSGSNNRKRSMPSGSTSLSMAQWVGQRPQKISRTRRANLVSPVSNPDDTQVSADGYSPSDFGARTNSSGIFRDGSNGKKHLKMKVENVTSPARFSEGEESVAGENKMKKKCTGVSDVETKAGTAFPNVGMPAMFAKKNKSPREDISDCVRKQGRNGRGSPFSTSSSSPFREKMENAAIAKPLRISRPTCDKNGSKTGRPPKKLVDRKGSYRRHANGSSPDFTGESDDDRDELFASVSFARNPNFIGSNSFWKNMEAVFAPINLQDTSYLAQQLQLAEELNKNLPQMTSRDSNCLGDPSLPATLVSGAAETDGIRQNEAVKSIKSVEWLNEFETPSQRPASERISNRITPLYRRVLSALIVEDEIEEFEELGTERNSGHQFSAHSLSCDNEPCKSEGKSGKFQLQFGTEMEKQSRAGLYFPYDGVNGSVGQNSPCNADKSLVGNGFSHEMGVLTGLCRNSLGGSPFEHSNGFGNSSCNDAYEQLCIEDKIFLELQSIGIYPEIVPDLDDQDDTWIEKEIGQLTKDYSQQVARKKASLNKVCELVSQQKEAEKGALEQVAMDRLVELAYKKLLATKGSIASKSGIPKVSKNVALAFAKRTLARCRVFEDSGISCFNESLFRDVLFAAPTPRDETEPTSTSGQRIGSSSNHGEKHGPCGNINGGSTYRQPDQGGLTFGGPVLHRGKKREVLLDDVSGSGGGFRSSSALEGSLLAGIKGKRSERGGETPSGGGGSFNKTKTNPKLKTSMLSSPRGNSFNKTETAAHQHPGTSVAGNRKKDGKAEQSKDIEEEEEALDLTNFPLPELDTIDELGAGNDLGGNQDLSSWFNFDEDGLHDQDLSMEGLEIPMDEIGDLNMF